MKNKILGIILILLFSFTSISFAEDSSNNEDYEDTKDKEGYELFKKAGYKYEKIGTANIEELQDEYVFRSGKGYTLYINDGKLTLMDYQDVIKYTMELPEESVVNDIKSMLESIGNVVRIKNEIKD